MGSEAPYDGIVQKLKYKDWQVELTSTVAVPEIGEGTISFPLENYTGTITLRYLKPSAANTTSVGAAQEAPECSHKHREQNDSPASVSTSAPVSLTSPPPCASSSNSIVTPGVNGAGIGGGKKALATMSAAAANKGRAGKRGKKQEEEGEEETLKGEAKAPSKARTHKTPRNSHEDSPGAWPSAPSQEDEEEEETKEAPVAAPVRPVASGVTASVTASPLMANAVCVPAPRWGHTATPVRPYDRMLVFGGVGDDDSQTYGDLFAYESEGRRWLRPINAVDGPRAWHTTTYLPHRNLLIVFGGERQSASGGAAEVAEEVRALDTELFLWYPPDFSGKPPTARSGHSASLVGDEIVLFGGSRGRKWQNSIVILDTDRWQWRHPSVGGDAPEGRTYHSATVVGSTVVIFGGNNGARCFNRVHVLRCQSPPSPPSTTHTTATRGHNSKAGSGGWEWFHPEVVGQAPDRRTGHCAVLLGDGKTILVHGGWDPQDETQDETKVFKDAFLLDTASWEWLPAPPQVSEALGFLTGHTATWIKGEVVVFGGQDAAGGRKNVATHIAMPQFRGDAGGEQSN